MSQQISYRIGHNLYLSITDRCTLECAFCPKTQGVRLVQDYDLSFDHRPELAEIIAAIVDPRKYQEVVFCGFGEPSLHLGVLLEAAQDIKAQGYGGQLSSSYIGSGELMNLPGSTSTSQLDNGPVGNKKGGKSGLDSVA